ncbi:MAG: hydroxymethylbilane synthase [Rhodospirillales bacterium]|nr:hydroxymethylbilane synthase [Rhodospirillales bacterium]HJN23466.1 hydroxymethylbilane synthase [Rhodospirillales bacterium]
MTATSSPCLRIGTRGSPLALAQTRQVRERLLAAHEGLGGPETIEITVIKTTGDKVFDRPLSEVGGKGLFSKEIDEAMLDGRVDLAVHSVKDLPTWFPDAIHMPCVLAREDPRDAFISRKAASIAALPANSVIGTASLRRQAQILHRRPDLRITVFRGNVATRLKKLDQGVVDATLLALAGLKRLHCEDQATAVIEADEILPAVGQGAVGVTCRADDARANDLLAPLNDHQTMTRVTAERAFLEVLDGSCRTPIAALAEFAGDGALLFRGLIARPDGSELLRAERRGAAAAAALMGHDAGSELRGRAGRGFFQQS